MIQNKHEISTTDSIRSIPYQEDSKILKLVIVFFLILLTAITVLALNDNGFAGIFGVLKSYGGAQVFIDLAISLSLANIWIWFDSKKNNRTFLPWFIISLLAGSYGILLYLLFRKINKK